jgi:hypothetical protein
LSAFFPPAAAYKAVKDQFSNDARFRRIQYFFDALAAKVNALELGIGSQAELSRTVILPYSGVSEQAKPTCERTRPEATERILPSGTDEQASSRSNSYLTFAAATCS